MSGDLPVRTGLSTSATANMPGDRGQSNVVGVALLLGATLVALGVLTASVGTIVDGHAARADADRVAADLDDAIRPVETTGHHSADVRFTDGSLRTVDRDLRIRRGGSTVRRVAIGGLVYERGDRRVRSVDGAVVRGRDEAAWTVDPPPVAGSESAGVLVVSAVRLNASDTAVGGGQVTTTLASNVSHERTTLGSGEYNVTIETAVPAAIESALREQGASATRIRHFDSDGVPSVEARFPGTRTGYLVVHDVRLEVSDG